MKKVLFLIVVIAVIAISSCGHKSTTVEQNLDSTNVKIEAVDSTTVE